VAVFGNTLHLAAAKGADPASSLSACLAREGISVRRLEKIEPSLEDVFVSLVEGKNRTLL
jgi:ABC-2 type transport system ATP-binding protein